MIALRATFYTAVLIVCLACSSTNATGTDGGTTAATGSIGLGNTSFVGTASSGTLSLSLANNASLDVKGITEVHITTSSGVLTLQGGCAQCLSGADPWCVAAGKTSGLAAFQVSQLDTTGAGQIQFSCNGSTGTLQVTSDSPAAATSDVPSAVLVKGTYSNNTPWSASATIQ